MHFAILKTVHMISLSEWRAGDVNPLTAIREQYQGIDIPARLKAHPTVSKILGKRLGELARLVQSRDSRQQEPHR